MRKILFPLYLIFFPWLIYCQSSDAELISRKTEVIISNGKLTQKEYFEIKINNRNGEEFTKVTVPFSKTYKVNSLEAFIKDWKGDVVRKLKNSEITERSSISYFSLYEDDFVKEFTLKHNTYPYYVCYSYQVQQSEFIHIEN